MPTKSPTRPIDANSQPAIPQMKATGQKRSLVRGKSTRIQADLAIGEAQGERDGGGGVERGV